MENSQFFLSQYANNPDEQAKFFGAARAASDRHAELAEIALIKSSIGAMAAPTFEDMRPHFSRFLASDAIAGFFRNEVECSLESDIHQAQGQSIDNEAMTGLQFIDTDHFAVATVVADPTSVAFKKHRNRSKPSSIMMTPKDLLVRFIKGGNAVVTVYTCDAITDESPATPDTSCRVLRTFRVEDGDELVLRAGRDSFTFESAETVVCFAQAYAKQSTASVMPEFDSATHRLIGLSATNDKASRIQMMATILRLFEHGDAFEACLPFAGHTDYFVRWYVMRELLAIDADRAWPLVEKMAEQDPHPDVRRTARRTLEHFRTPIAA
ncbi:HEAT repeat domain-containing protein [Lysobacter sp. A3-1-A15]|uniref:HEAT repeat domain-containing protein n=1 Tax=Novilysobacter viscosus TaxID=3098602 RepID=UPI002ED87EB5